jgi:hypothetical protein
MLECSVSGAKPSFAGDSDVETGVHVRGVYGCWISPADATALMVIPLLKLEDSVSEEDESEVPPTTY